MYWYGTDTDVVLENHLTEIFKSIGRNIRYKSEKELRKVLDEEDLGDLRTVLVEGKLVQFIAVGPTQ